MGLFESGSLQPNHTKVIDEPTVESRGCDNRNQWTLDNTVRDVATNHCPNPCHPHRVSYGLRSASQRGHQASKVKHENHHEIRLNQGSNPVFLTRCL